MTPNPQTQRHRLWAGAALFGTAVALRVSVSADWTLVVMAVFGIFLIMTSFAEGRRR